MIVYCKNNSRYNPEFLYITIAAKNNSLRSTLAMHCSVRLTNPKTLYILAEFVHIRNTIYRNWLYDK